MRENEAINKSMYVDEIKPDKTEPQKLKEFPEQNITVDVENREDDEIITNF